MTRLLLIALAGSGAVLASACSPSMTEPFKACVSWGPQYQMSRGGWTADCREYRIMCTPPLILEEAPDNKLMCRLKRENEALPPS